MDTTRELSQRFLVAAQAIGDRMLLELQDRDPQFAETVVHAFGHGHRLQVALVIGEQPAIELQLVDDYQIQRRVCLIPMGVGGATCAS